MNRAFRAPRLIPTTKEGRKAHAFRAWIGRIAESNVIQRTAHDVYLFAQWRMGLVPTRSVPRHWHASTETDVPLEEQNTVLLPRAPVDAWIATPVIPTPIMWPVAAPATRTDTDPLRIIPTLRDDAPAPERVPILTYRSPLTAVSACVIDTMQRFRAENPDWEIGCIHMHPFTLSLLKTVTRPGAPYIGIPIYPSSDLTSEQVRIFGADK